MKQKVSELEGYALDRAVAKAEGLHVDGWERLPDEEGGHRFVMVIGDGSSPNLLGRAERWTPSRAWEHGGPIIERELICLDTDRGLIPGASRVWYAYIWNDPKRWLCIADRPLTAAMRLHVMTKLGDEVDLDGP